MAKDFDVAAYKSPTNVFMKLGAQYAGECTTYAWGRAYEVIGAHTLPNSAPSKWYDASHGYTTSTTTPKAPGIGCFSGHVAFIESYDGTTITYSEANWYMKTDAKYSDGKWDPEPNGTDGKLKSLSKKDFEAQTGGGTFKGYIHLKK